MKKNKSYTKNEAIKASMEFIKEVNLLEEKYGITFNSDSGDVYLSYENSEKNSSKWGTVNLGWLGDGSGIKVTEPLKDEVYYRKQALSKLSEEEKKALGISV